MQVNEVSERVEKKKKKNKWEVEGKNKNNGKHVWAFILEASIMTAFQLLLSSRQKNKIYYCQVL